MRILVLGGTGWLGGYLARTALDREHDVTCLARGESGTMPAGARHVRGDRDRPDAYDAVAGESWDVVLDVARQPGHVRRAAAALADRSDAYVFISSASVYADESTAGSDEGADLLPALDGDVMETMETYGEAKVACERHVLDAYGPDRCLLLRVGLIGGPGDVSDRTGYWPLRFARPAADDGSVLVPDTPELSTQVIDVRDLSTWTVEAAERRLSGIFNVMGEPVPLRDHLATAREVAGHTGPIVGVDQAWLQSHEIQPWMGERSLPLWLPLPEYAGFAARAVAAARAEGLRTRPLAETLADTLDWELAQPAGRPRRAGLSDADERTLLRELAG